MSTPTQERATIGLPCDLSAALRERLRQIDGADIADAPLAFVLRYLVARFVGIPHNEATRYTHYLPRGETRESNYPNVADLIRQ